MKCSLLPVPPAEREKEMWLYIDEMANESALGDSDGPSVTWKIKGFEHREDYSFVEVEPSREIDGCSRLKFAVHFWPGSKPKLAGCYEFRDDAFYDGGWASVFTMAGYDCDELDRLHFQETGEPRPTEGTGEPMPIEEREEWIQRSIQAIGEDGWPGEEVTWTLRGMVHKDAYSFVEAEAPLADAVGWSRFKFVMLMQAGGRPTIVGCYALEETGWGLVFTRSVDTPSDWEQLHDSSS